MAFVVEDGTGKSDATSYATVSFADDYHADFGNPSAWTSLSTADKQANLMLATRYVDAVYQFRWIGQKATRDQALDWPRVNAWSSEWFVLESDSIPTELQQAVAVLALKAVSDDLLPDVDSGTTGIVRERVSAGRNAVLEDVSYSGTKAVFKTYSLAQQLLGPLLTSGNTLERA